MLDGATRVILGNGKGWPKTENQRYTWSKEKNTKSVILNLTFLPMKLNQVHTSCLEECWGANDFTLWSLRETSRRATPGLAETATASQFPTAPGPRKPTKAKVAHSIPATDQPISHFIVICPWQVKPTKRWATKEEGRSRKGRRGGKRDVKTPS